MVREKLGFILLLASILFLGATTDTAQAGCVSCDTLNGECTVLLPHLSGNCACIIRVRFGAVICKPSGVCDPQDPNTCEENSFPPKLAPSPAFKLDLESLAFLRKDHPLLEAALFAASNSSMLRDGEISGTIKIQEKLPAVEAPVGSVFAYDVRVQVFSTDLKGGHASDWVTFYVRLENARTGEIAEYDGQLQKFGRQGSITARIDGVSGDVMNWSEKDKD